MLEVARVISNEVLETVEPWRLEAVTASQYAVDTALIDSPSEYAQRIAAMFAYYQAQIDTLSLMMSADGEVTLTRPDGTTITVPSLSSVLHSVEASQKWFDTNLPLVEKAGQFAAEAKAGAQTATTKAGEAVTASTTAVAKATIATDAATKAEGHESRAAAAAKKAEELVDQATGGSLLKEQNLADLPSAESARQNLHVPSIDDLEAVSRNLAPLLPAGSAAFVYTNGLLTQMTEQLPTGERVTAYSYTEGQLTQAVETFGLLVRTTTYTYQAGILAGFTVTEVSP
ncbi:hypothetical protein ACSZNV_12600 [Aeromonas hydrophila]